MQPALPEDRTGHDLAGDPDEVDIVDGPGRQGVGVGSVG